ncbi:galactose ABC transporter substrate-binding protein [Clostridium vincentii]|uniref:D-galactose/methyl-galactoside binding periplasmic protein MglB n=1 Tax=Clostridium vincentii TaxID=52704 RepID=A0A2T0BAZ2_9CLOT|nr:galactose ABC transporter substrate-binding protein [Clostridium vincentii]PRR81003.1 D-galactose-binding periplasmic protein precursor [Clostridium vincentii]
MIKLKKILIITLVIFMINSILTGYAEKMVMTNSRVVEGKPVKVGVLLLDFTDDFISLIGRDLEEIQRRNIDKIEFTFFDGKGDQTIQDENLDTLLKTHVDLILLNLIEVKNAQPVIDKIKQANIPVILFQREPITIEPIKSYEKAYYIGTDSKEAGILQGQILVDKWNTDKTSIDKNRDDVMQYIILKGEKDNLEELERTKHSILTINNAGIKTEELASTYANWNRELAKEAILSFFLKYGNRIEVIIANDDTMAEGVIDALQTYGYNKGDKTPTIAVIGVDALPSVQELIRKGIMTGSVLQDDRAMAETMYTMAMNLVSGKPPLEGTQYKFDDTGVAVRIPYQEFKISD